jgi:hypothetical protein
VKSHKAVVFQRKRRVSLTFRRVILKLKLNFTMKKALFLLIIVLFSQCYRRYPPISLMPPIPEWDYKGLECGWFGTMNTEERRALFPFNEATKILLISYANHENGYGSAKFVREDSITIYMYANLLKSGKSSVKRVPKPIVLDTIKAFDKVYEAYEIVELSQSQIDSLSNLALNYKPKGEFSMFTETVSCYTPRNAILFYDKNGKLILNLEACFRCNKIYLYPADENLEAFKKHCRSPELVRAFFSKQGIHYGVDFFRDE